MKFKEFIDRHKKRIIYFLILSIISISLYLVLYFTGRQGYVQQADNSFIVCFTFFLFGCLSIISNLGFFDTMAYGLRNGISYIFKNERVYKDLYEYKELKVERRKFGRFNFILYFIISLIYLIVFVVFYTIYRTNL